MDQENLPPGEFSNKIAFLEAELNRLREGLAEIQKKSERFKSLVEKSEEVLTLVDGQGFLRYTSPSIEAVLGFGPEELIGTHFSQLSHPEEQSYITELFRHILKHPGLSLKLSGRLRHKSGKYMQCEGSGVNRMDEPSLEAVVVSFRDVSERLEAEEKFKITENFYKTILEKAPDGIALIGTDGKMKYASPSAARIFRYKNMDPLPDPLEFTHPDDRSRVLEKLGFIIQNPSEIATTEYRFKSANGDWRWIESTFSNQYAEEGIEALVINFRDIHDKMLVQQALKMSEERYRRLAENLPDTTVAFLDDSFRITFITGKEIEARVKNPFDLTGKPIAEVFSQASMAKMEPLFLQAFHGKKGSIELEYQGQYYQAVVVPIIEPDQTIREIQLISQNVTEKILAEKLRNQWADAFYYSGHGMAIGLPGSNTILTCNHAFARLQGLTVEEISTKPILQMYATEVHEHVKSCIAEADHTGHKQYEAVMVRKDGSHYPVLMDVVSVKDEHGIILYRVVTQQDITERKKSEQRILQMNEDLERRVEERTRELTEANVKLNELNATKDKFFSIIAHDLRNPFNSILSFSRLLLESFEDLDPEKAQNSLAKIRNSAENAYSLLDNLLEWARSQTGKMAFHPEGVFVSDLIRTAVESTESMAAAKQISIIPEVKDGMQIFADRNMVTTILRNLLTNSIKFTPSGGRVEIGCKEEGSGVCVFVRDNGIGMNAETLSKLFRINEKVSRPGTANEHGTGLGLILSKEFAERNGGMIRAESEEGKGSVFSFIVPVSLPDQQ